MRFAVSTAATEVVTAGGTCMGGTMTAACADTHGVDIPLTIYREGRTFEQTVASSDRNRFFKAPSLH